MENNYRENIWLLKLGIVLTPKFNYWEEDRLIPKGAQWSFYGTGEQLSELLTTMSK